MQVSVEHKPDQDEHRETNQGLEPVPDVYSMGDCCANVETPLPALAQARGGPPYPGHEVRNSMDTCML